MIDDRNCYARPFEYAARQRIAILKPKGPHRFHQLTQAHVRKPLAVGRWCDGNGLYLVVDLGGAKRWILRTMIRGKRSEMGLGSAALVSLADARKKARCYRRMARNGGDPITERSDRHVTGLTSVSPIKKRPENGG